MNKTTKIIVGGIVVVLAAWGFSMNNVPSKTIKIGLVAPLTGPGAVFGNSLVKGAEMAIQDLATKKLRYTYELVIQDDGTNPATSASAASKLVNVDKVQAIIAGTSGTGNAILSITEAAKVPHICVVCADVKIGQGKYNFTNSVLPDDEARAWMDEAAKRGAKNIGLITQIHPGINAVADAITKEAGERKVPIVYAERYDGNNRDFKTIVAKAKKFNADVYFLMSFPPSIDIVGKELQDFGIKNLSGGAGALSIAANPSIFNGDWYTEVPLADPSFLKRFETQYPEIRFNIRTAPFGYDSVNLLVAGFEKDADMAEYLAGIKEYDGKAGHITKPSGNNFRATPSIWEIRDGKPVEVR